MNENGMNYVTKGDAVMIGMNDEAGIKANIEVVDHYLKGEFVNFAIAHEVDNTRTHTVTVDNGKNRFTLLVEWPLFVERGLTPASIARGLRNEHVAEEMRLHGEKGYHWTPSLEDTTQPNGL